jgi:Ca2+-transporting ATPase
VAGLLGAVMTADLIAWYGTRGLAQTQDIAFFTWLLGHLSLALNLRSDRQPLFQLGLRSNRLMLFWVAGTAVFVLLVAYVPELRLVCRGIAPTAGQWAMMIGLVLIGAFWMDVRKLGERESAER